MLKRKARHNVPDRRVTRSQAKSRKICENGVKICKYGMKISDQTAATEDDEFSLHTIGSTCSDTSSGLESSISTTTMDSVSDFNVHDADSLLAVVKAVAHLCKNQLSIAKSAANTPIAQEKYITKCIKLNNLIMLALARKFDCQGVECVEGSKPNMMFVVLMALVLRQKRRLNAIQQWASIYESYTVSHKVRENNVRLFTLLMERLGT